MLITRNLLAYHRGSEIHNEILHDESAAFAIERKYPESATRLSSPPSTSKPEHRSLIGCCDRGLSESGCRLVWCPANPNRSWRLKIARAERHLVDLRRQMCSIPAGHSHVCEGRSHGARGMDTH
jgi:hypothetical protein